MRIVYTIRTRPESRVPVPVETPSITIDDATVDWVLADDGCFDAVRLGFVGAEVRLSDEGVILTECPEFENRAYALAVYLGNRMFAQTIYDPIDPEQVFAGTPEVYPENEEEEETFKGRPRRTGISIRSSHRIHGQFDPSAYVDGFNNRPAHGFFTDALRNPDCFQQFQLYFKVVEHFFPFKGGAQDAAVSAHLAALDSRFSQDAVRRLRLCRNRCAHPRARQGHLGPHDRLNYRVVHADIPLMKVLSELLLQHPPANV